MTNYLAIPDLAEAAMPTGGAKELAIVTGVGFGIAFLTNRFVLPRMGYTTGILALGTGLYVLGYAARGLSDSR